MLPFPFLGAPAALGMLQTIRLMRVLTVGQATPWSTAPRRAGIPASPAPAAVPATTTSGTRANPASSEVEAPRVTRTG